MIANLHFMRPEWLWSLVPAALFAALLWRRHRQHGSWDEVIDPALLPHLVAETAIGKRRNLAPALLIAWVLAALAASGPAWQQLPQPVHQKQDALVIALDLSYSMKAGDLAPSRVDRARQKIRDVLRSRTEGQTALVAYAGDAHVVTPLTDDTPTIANLLPALNPDMMPVPGSEPLAAIERALQLLRSAGIRQGRILLVTDGISEKDRKVLAKTLTNSGTELSVLAVGTAAGAPMPLPRGGFVKDHNGTIVTPGLDEDPLRELATDTSGRFSPLRAGSGDLDYLLAPSALPTDDTTVMLDRTADAWEDEGHWLILALLPFALAGFRRGWLLSLLPLCLMLPAAPGHADAWDDLWFTRDQQGQRALRAGDAESAQQLFEQSDWAGTAAYQQGDFESAAKRFAASDSADAWYNRGNALARAGKLDEAIAAYEESLTRAPEREDALANKKLLEDLKQQQQQQQQSSDNDSESSDESQQQQDEQNNSADNQQGEQSPEDQNQSGQNQGQDNRDEQPPEDQDQRSGEPEQPEQESEDENAASEREQEQQPPADEDSGEQSPEDGEAGAAKASEAEPSAEEQERNQAMEQWLRRVPDDPSGLLREKFRYESDQQRRHGQEKRNDTNW